MIQKKYSIIDIRKGKYQTVLFLKKMKPPTSVVKKKCLRELEGISSDDNSHSKVEKLKMKNSTWLDSLVIIQKREKQIIQEENDEKTTKAFNGNLSEVNFGWTPNFSGKKYVVKRDAISLDNIEYYPEEDIEYSDDSKTVNVSDVGGGGNITR